MTKSFLTLLGLWLLAVPDLDAQSLTLTNAGHTPLPGATIVGQPSGTFAVTGQDGQADLSPFPPADTLMIQLLGYKTQQITYAAARVQGFRVQLEMTALALDQVVVSASRWAQNASHVPNRVATIRSEEVLLRNPQTAADLLGSSGEVFIQKSQQGGGSPMIRGFATNRLLIAVDGVRMNTAIFRSGNLQNVISLDPFATEQTELLFGPGSVLYGSDAIGGVMAFYTLTPTLADSQEPESSGSGTLRYASANEELTGHFDINIGGQKWAAVSSFSHNRYGDLRMGQHGPDDYLRPFYVERIDGADRVVSNPDPLLQTPTGYEQTNLMQKVRFRPSAAWDFTYAFHYSATTDYARYDRLVRDRNGVPRSAEWSYGPQVWQMNQLQASHTGQNMFYDEARVSLAHQFFEESRIDRDFGDPVRRTRTEAVDALSANLDFTKRIGRHQRLLYGLEALYNKVASEGQLNNLDTGAEDAGPARYPQANWQSYAAYLTYQLEVNPKLRLQAGARYNHFLLDADFDTTFFPFPFTNASLNNGALTGSIGAVYRPAPSWGLRANFSTGFRAPNVDDMGKVFDSEPGSVVVPNPNLGAEYAYNAELGFSKVISDVLQVDLTGYYTLLDNALVRREFALSGQDSILYDGTLSRVQAVQNAAQAWVYGVQAGIGAQWPNGLGLHARFNFQEGEEELEEGGTTPLRHAAPWFGVFRVQYEQEAFRLELNAQYHSAFAFEELPLTEQDKPYLYAADANGNPYAPAWYTLDFRALYRISETFTLSAGVENLTDQRYRPYSSGLAGSGRNVVLSGRVGF
ncbi:MAG: TonB-dependent receptor domain-containing protein [Phaeodactylibacter xiamenensis]|uniref:TonB-dependent receptor n=1 Tax=Phaeodactylibacter xiamenensis TaxID=1524460 RepID=UPI0005C5F8DB|nr:TonB-dependent receptor [Phaeodactylibacter xiamenensis]MCR9054366.1 TonB-dependent receptor [bacterium]